MSTTSTMFGGGRTARRLVTVAAVAAIGIAAACSPADRGGDGNGGGGGGGNGGGGGGGGDKTTVTFRLWDETVAEAYEESFAEFEKQNDDIDVEIELVPWDNYWEALPQDVGGGTMADIYWTNTSNFGLYADNGNLIDVGEELADQVDDWQPAVVDLYTRDDKQWGIPQLWDSIALYYNADLLDEAGVDPAELEALIWRPDGADTFLPVAQQLTLDSNGNQAGSDDFDAEDVEQWGFNAALDPQAIYWDFIGSNGGTWQDGDQFSMGDDPKTAEAMQYLVDLIHEFEVSPPASDTNTDGERTLQMFLQGKMALYQSGPYRLKAIEEGADFEWGIAPMLQGPEGRVSVVNGIVAVGNADTENREETLRVMSWLGTADGQRPIAEGGYAFPGIEEVESSFIDYWSEQGADIQPFVDVASGDTYFPPPTGPRVQAGTNAIQDTLQEMMLGRTPVTDALTEAQQIGNDAMAE